MPQFVLAGVQFRCCLLQRLPLASGEPPVVLERLQIALDSGEVIGELRLPLAPMRTRLSDDLGRHPQSRGDLERETAAR